MAHIILLRGITEIGQTADSWQGWTQVYQPSQNLQTALWGKKIPISKFFSFWSVCTYFTYKINFLLFLLSIIFLNALDNGYRAFSNVVNLSNQIFHLRNHFCLLLARCHCVLLTKRKNPSFRFKTLQSALWHLENLSFTSSRLGPRPAFLESISSIPSS